jgi:rhodanese-related sulfurtransferase
MDYETIDCATLQKWLESGEAVLVDVREPGEYEMANIAQSILVPLGELACDRLPSHDTKIVIHCLKGGRGQKACETLLAENSELDLYNLEGGISAWIELGLPVQN